MDNYDDGKNIPSIKLKAKQTGNASNELIYELQFIGTNGANFTIDFHPLSITCCDSQQDPPLIEIPSPQEVQVSSVMFQ